MFTNSRFAECRTDASSHLQVWTNRRNLSYELKLLAACKSLVARRALSLLLALTFNSALDAQQQPRWDSAPAGSRHPHSQRRTLNCTAHSQAQAQPITLSPKVLARAPSEQSKVYERLEESVADKVNLCAAAASIITGTRRYFALSASLDPRNPRFNNAGLRRNGGGKLVQRGDRRRG